jgi:hypothetical protein
MNLTQLGSKAGFYTNGNEVFSPNVKERITEQLIEFLKIVEDEILTDVQLGFVAEEKVRFAFAQLRG